MGRRGGIDKLEPISVVSIGVKNRLLKALNARSILTLILCSGMESSMGIISIAHEEWMLWGWISTIRFLTWDPCECNDSRLDPSVVTPDLLKFDGLDTKL